MTLSISQRTLYAFGCLVLLACAAMVARGQQNAALPPTFPRFQLYNMEYPVSGGSYKQQGVFRIDTQTGETKQFMTGITADKKYYAIWESIVEK